MRPAGHKLHPADESTAVAEEYLPFTQSWHVLSEDAPLALEYLPFEHAEHLPDPSFSL